MFTSQRKIIVSLFLVSIVIAISSLGLWWFGVNNLSTQRGRLNISKIADDNRLKVIQQDIDVFIDVASHDGCKYTAILPFSVQAGFDLNKCSINQETDDNGNNTSISIDLPEPEILNVDKADNASTVTLRERDSGKMSSLNKAHKIFGQELVKNVALERGILNQANKRAKSLLTAFVKTSFPGIPLSISTASPKTGVKKVEITSRNLPISFHTYEKNLEKLNFYTDNKLLHFGFAGQTIDKAVNFFVAKAGKAKDLEKILQTSGDDYGRLFSPIHLDLKVYCLPLNDISLAYYYLFNGYLYEFRLIGKDKDSLYKHLPDFLPLLLSAQLNPDLTPPVKQDDYGLTKDMWKNFSIKEMRQYFIVSMYNNFLRRNPEKIDYEKTSSGLSIFYDKEEILGDEIFTKVREAIQDIRNQQASELTSSLPESFKQFTDENIISVFYNHNTVYRDRYVFFTPEGLLLYLPKGKLISDVVIWYYPYKKISLKTGSQITLNKDKIEFIYESSEKSFGSEALSSFLKWLFDPENKTYIDLFHES